MTITAKFPASCASCGGRIIPGQRIEWSKGAPARHTSCPGATAGTQTATYLGRVLVADLPRGRSQRDPDSYIDRRTGERLMRGCSACRRAGTMCRQCAFDEYDN